MTAHSDASETSRKAHKTATHARKAPTPVQEAERPLFQPRWRRLCRHGNASRWGINVPGRRPGRRLLQASWPSASLPRPYRQSMSRWLPAAPLAKSRKKTKMPKRRPSTLPTLVAPILPLPCWRMSTPRPSQEITERDGANEVGAQSHRANELGGGSEHGWVSVAQGGSLSYHIPFGGREHQERLAQPNCAIPVVWRRFVIQGSEGGVGGSCR